MPDGKGMRNPKILRVHRTFPVVFSPVPTHLQMKIWKSDSLEKLDLFSKAAILCQADNRDDKVDRATKWCLIIPDEKEQTLRENKQWKGPFKTHNLCNSKLEVGLRISLSFENL